MLFSPAFTYRQLAVLIAILSFPSAALAARTTALLPVQAPASTPPHLVQGIEKAVRDEVAGMQHARLQMKRPSQKTTLNCQVDDVSCFVQLGEKLDVQQLLSLSLSGEGSQLKLSLVAYDVSARVVEGKMEGLLPPGLDAAQKKARNMIVQLLDPGSAVGSLLIRTQQAGAEVFIDGVAHGTTPLAGPIERLTEGRHLVKLRLSEYREYESFVQVHRGAELLLEVQMQKEGLSSPKDSLAPKEFAMAKGNQKTEGVVVKSKDISPLFFAGGAAMGVGAALLVAAVGIGAVGAFVAGAPVTSIKGQVEQAQNVNTAWGTAAVLGVTSSLLLGSGAVALAVPLLTE